MRQKRKKEEITRTGNGEEKDRGEKGKYEEKIFKIGVWKKFESPSDRKLSRLRPASRNSRQRG